MRIQLSRFIVILVLHCGLVGFLNTTLAQKATVSDEPLSNRLVKYNMDVELDPASKSIDGKQRLTWRNPDTRPVKELQFHLYLNAFRNENSTFMKESGGSHRGFTPGDDDPWGGIDINRMQIVTDELTDTTPLGGSGETDLTDEIEYIQPDDENSQDMTVISVPLPEPLGPGESITLDIDFTSRMPEIFARTGWERKGSDSLFFMVAQWFPKIGVYEIPGQRYLAEDAPSGKWSTHQFHANSEFYADFGTYDVTITTPDYYEIGASGVLIDEVIEDGKRKVHYRAEDVHDFAWTSSGDYLVFEDEWKHVKLRLMLQPEHKAQVERHFAAAKIGLEYFDKWVGPYPYSTLTLVDGMGGSNGMEYPTLITCGTAYLLPEWMRFLELVTIHEFGHQYFYGLLASNEAEEAWLDEGINSYVEMRIMDEVYGEASAGNLTWIKISDGNAQRLGYIANKPERGPIFKKSWEYNFNSDYGKASYSKPATVLKTLENYLGWDVMHKILQTYYQEWRFRHPTTQDFIDVAERVSGESLDWFFDQFVYGTAIVDYAVEEILISPGDAGTVTSEVKISRLNDGIFPNTVRVIFENDIEETIEWEGEEEEKIFTFERPVPVVEAHVDPNNDIWVDVNPLNNRKRVEPETKFARLQLMNFTVWLQQVLHIAGAMF